MSGPGQFFTNRAILDGTRFSPPLREDLLVSLML